MFGFIPGSEVTAETTSLDKLAKAVAMQETHGCKDKTNFTAVNNCHGIRKWDGKNLVPARYATKKESYDDFKDIWIRLYGGRDIPTLADAKRYSGDDRAEIWHRNVLIFLHNG